MYDRDLHIFSTCPQSADHGPADFLRRAVDVARWSEVIGCEGMLIYSDNRLVDPWLVAQSAIEATESLAPLVAVQPIYMHPYTVAKMVSSLGYLYGRRIYLNMIAGGFKNDLLAMNDTTAHDARYERLTEYTHIILELLDRSAAGEVAAALRGYAEKGYRTFILDIPPDEEELQHARAAFDRVETESHVP